MSKNNNSMKNIKFFFVKSNKLSTKPQEIITSVESVNDVTKTYGQKTLFTYLEDEYKINVKKSEIHDLEKEYQELIDNPIVISLPSLEKVNEQGISDKKLIDFLDETYNQTILKLAAKSKASKNNKKTNLFQKMQNFFQRQKCVETEKTNQQKFLELTK